MDQSPFCSTVFLWALPQLHSESFLCHLTSCICVASMKIDSLGNFKPSKATNVMVLRLEAKLSVILEKYDHPSGRSTPLFVHPFFPLTNNSSDPPEMPQKKLQNAEQVGFSARLRPFHTERRRTQPRWAFRRRPLSALRELGPRQRIKHMPYNCSGNVCN